MPYKTMHMTAICDKPILPAQSGGKPRKTRKSEFPGLTEDAATLGVSRYFLWSCLKGHATSAPLMQRYRDLQAQKTQAAKP